MQVIRIRYEEVELPKIARAKILIPPHNLCAGQDDKFIKTAD